MSGNPYGLSGISHYGTMQRVGGKAAGFINKKFFHPSSLRNQEKLWLAMSANEVEEKKQAEMDKRRDEERQVEELRKQMYLAGQAGKSSGDSVMLGAIGSRGSGAPQHMTKEQKELFEVQQSRKKVIKQENYVALMKQEGLKEGLQLEDDSDDEVPEKSKPPVPEAEVMASLAKSTLYTEDVSVKGHNTVWGSWYAKEEEKWGFICCKTLDRNKRCPLAPEEEEEKEKPAKQERQTRGKRRRRGGGAAEASGAPAEAAPEAEAPAQATSASSSDAVVQTPLLADGDEQAAAATVDTDAATDILARIQRHVADTAAASGAPEPATSIEELPAEPS